MPVTMRQVQKISREVVIDPSETTRRPPFKTNAEKAAYIRGFFDAEGGIPHSRDATLYIQLVQKDKKEIQNIKDVLYSLGVKTGVLHNPSRRVDPNYWRIFVSTASHANFARIIGSWHPAKQARFAERMMI